MIGGGDAGRQRPTSHRKRPGLRHHNPRASACPSLGGRLAAPAGSTGWRLRSGAGVPSRRRRYRPCRPRPKAANARRWVKRSNNHGSRSPSPRATRYPGSACGAAGMPHRMPGNRSGNDHPGFRIGAKPRRQSAARRAPGPPQDRPIQPEATGMQSKPPGRRMCAPRRLPATGLAGLMPDRRAREASWRPRANPLRPVPPRHWLPPIPRRQPPQEASCWRADWRRAARCRQLRRTPRGRVACCAHPDPRRCPPCGNERPGVSGSVVVRDRCRP